MRSWLTGRSDLEQALYASKIISYAQGFMLMREAAKVNSWDLNYAGIAAMWRGGCIIKVSPHPLQHGRQHADMD